MRLDTSSFIRFTCLSLDEQKTMKTMYMGKTNVPPEGSGPYQEQPIVRGQKAFTNEPPPDNDNDDESSDYETSVMDRKEAPDEDDFKQMADAIEAKKQQLISRLDDAITGGLFDQDTKDKLLMHVIQVVKEYANRYKNDFDGLSVEERDATLRDVIEHTYHSLVYKTNGISPSLMPTTRTKEQLELDEYLRHNVQF